MISSEMARYTPLNTFNELYFFLQKENNSEQQSYIQFN